ncbi:chloramphenicol resistance protein [Puteibacter caeruleilacunae]|nr:chloramphenicol resistance protein [Puteibacter caeruleilacunae]
MKKVSSVNELTNAIASAQPGDVIGLNDGVYQDIKLVVTNSGTKDQNIIIKAINPGKAFFSGDVKVELRGEYITLDGIYFKDGARNTKEWKSHGPGLVAMYGSHNRVTNCAFHCFDQANSAYITTSLTEEGKVPQYCRIDHCSFTEKITFDQVINLNNTPKKSEEGEPGIPMYHRIDHCFFANPQKPGNAGGGIRVGYWRKDFGRCLVDSNLFMRQDSEAEIITSKSMENVYYANTYLNCQGTMNFRHGDKQVAINNFYIGNDKKYGYGGMFVWGSNHIIASNYFELPTTREGRGSGALYLNPGAEGREHALAFNILVANNLFANNNGYSVHFNPLYDRRVDWCEEKNYKFELPRDIQFRGNVFYNDNQGRYTFMKDDHPGDKGMIWNSNLAYGSKLGITKPSGINTDKFKLNRNTDGIFTSNHRVNVTQGVYNIEGIDLDIPAKVNAGIVGKPLSWENVGPDWLKEIPGTYAVTGELAPDVQVKFDEVTAIRKKK